MCQRLGGAIRYTCRSRQPQGMVGTDAATRSPDPRAQLDPGRGCAVLRHRPIPCPRPPAWQCLPLRSEEHTSELQSLMRISYAVFCLKKKKKQDTRMNNTLKTNAR